MNTRFRGAASKNENVQITCMRNVELHKSSHSQYYSRNSWKEWDWQIVRQSGLCTGWIQMELLNPTMFIS